MIVRNNVNDFCVQSKCFIEWNQKAHVQTISLINKCIKIIRASVKHLKEATPFALDEVGNSLPYQYT